VSTLAIKPSYFIALIKPILKHDLVYHALMTKSIGILLTQHTIKATRLQLNEIRRRFGTGMCTYDLGHDLQIEFDLTKNLDAFMYDYLLKFGRYEREVESVLSELITKETTFIDVGANLGYFTILCSRLAETVYAFDPVPVVFERLSRNISLNNLKNVRPFQCAVSKERSRLRIFESRISDGHDSIVKRFEHDKSILVDAVTLDETVEPSARNIVMKVDAEGSEMEVVQGALGLIKSGMVSAIVVEWARPLYSCVADLRERFALYSALGSVEVLDDRPGSHIVRERHEIPEYCNLLIRVRR
jgi:FkbM family methyltransferase